MNSLRVCPSISTAARTDPRCSSCRSWANLVKGGKTPTADKVPVGGRAEMAIAKRLHKRESGT